VVAGGCVRLCSPQCGHVKLRIEKVSIIEIAPAVKGCVELGRGRRQEAGDERSGVGAASVRTTHAGGESGAMPFAGDGRLLRRAGVRCAPVLVSGLFWLTIGDGPSTSSPRHSSHRHPSPRQPSPRQPSPRQSSPRQPSGHAGHAGHAGQAGRAAGIDKPAWIKVSPGDALDCGASVLCTGCVPTGSQGNCSTNVRICQGEQALLPCEGLPEKSFGE
jgi:hypothetical protein